MWYHIKALACGISFIGSFASFGGCHGNGGQELIQNREKWGGGGGGGGGGGLNVYSAPFPLPISPFAWHSFIVTI